MRKLIQHTATQGAESVRVYLIITHWKSQGYTKIAISNCNHEKIKCIAIVAVYNTDRVQFWSEIYRE